MEQNVQLYQTQQAGNGKRLGGHSKMEMTDVASNYTAVSNPRQAMVSRTQGSSSVHYSSKTSRSRRASLEADIPGYSTRDPLPAGSEQEAQGRAGRLESALGQGDRENPSNVRRGAEAAPRLLDDAERMKGEKDAKLASLDAYNKDMRASNNQNESCNEKIDRQNHELSDRDGEIALLRRRLAQLEGEKTRVKQQMIKMKEDLARLHTDLDAETATRIGAQTENQTLKEELEFLKRVHDQEIKELYVLVKKDEDESREFWKTELGQAIHEIQKEYDDKVDLLRELAKNNNQGTSETTYLKEENKKMKDMMAELRKKIADQQARNDSLERMIEELQREHEVERRRHSEEQERLGKELTNTETDLRRVLNELQALLDAKISLELEIAAYRKLLDAEGVAMEKVENISRQGSFRTTEKPTSRASSGGGSGGKQLGYGGGGSTGGGYEQQQTTTILRRGGATSQLQQPQSMGGYNTRQQQSSSAVTYSTVGNI
uniref:IF rod domain-containing protein n=1 Tax=Macrostomum lignano TaxID=282301 RepID=A0A1I8F2R9_9PLAT